MNLYPNHRANTLHFIGFNPKRTEFFTGTDEGFRIYQCSPFRRVEKNDIRGIGVVAQIGENENQQYALVAGGSKPAFVSNTRVNFFAKGKWIRELTFSSQVLNICSVGNFFAIILEESITLYCAMRQNLEKIVQIRTTPNIGGICDVVYLPLLQSVRIVYPHKDRGKIVITTITIRNRNQHGSKKVVLTAHKTALRTAVFNPSGTMIATSSATGTLIRVFSLEPNALGKKLFEFRRGSTRAVIYSLSFSKDEKYLAVTSSSGTLHVFSMVDGSSDYLISKVVSYHPSIGRHKNEELVDVPHIAKFVNEEMGEKEKVNEKEEQEEEEEEDKDDVGGSDNFTSIGILTACGLFVTLKFDFLQSSDSGQGYISPSFVDTKKIMED